MAEKTALYRHFDEYSVLLYVGITDSFSARTETHIKCAQWSDYADHSSAIWYPSRERAEAAERAAITSELPVFNRAYATGSTDDRIDRYIENREMIGAFISDREPLRKALRDEAQRLHEEEISKVTRPYNGDQDEVVGLREAFIRGIVAVRTLSNLRRRRVDDANFPKPVGRTGPGKTAQHLYRVRDLRAWDYARVMDEAS